MSLAVLDRQSCAQNGVAIYLSVDGAGALPVEALKGVVQHGGQVKIAFDADKSGELMAWRVAQQLPGAVRSLPTSKDWNKQLMVTNQAASSMQERVLPDLWNWHQAASSLSHPEPYLNRIVEVAISSLKGEALSDRARAAMEKDLGQMAAKTPCHKCTEQER